MTSHRVPRGYPYKKSWNRQNSEWNWWNRNYVLGGGAEPGDLELTKPEWEVELGLEWA